MPRLLSCPNLKIFTDALSTAAPSFTAQRIFDTMFSDLFEVSVYSQNTRIVRLISRDMPPPDTDPPRKSLHDPAGDKDVLIRELFAPFVAPLRAHIAAKGGELSVKKAGEFLRNRNDDFEARVAESALGKDNVVTQIARALRFRILGAGAEARIANQ